MHTIDSINTLISIETADTLQPSTPVETIEAIADTTIATLPVGNVPAPTAEPAAAEPAKPARKQRTNGKRKPVATKPVKPEPAAKPAREPAQPYYAAARDAATFSANATHYGETSNRDDAYLAFYTLAAKREANRPVTLAALHDSGVPVDASKPRGKRRNPHYTGSSKATDAGALVRAAKAGHIAMRDNGTTYVLTSRGADRGRAILNSLRKRAATGNGDNA